MRLSTLIATAALAAASLVGVSPAAFAAGSTTETYIVILKDGETARKNLAGITRIASGTPHPVEHVFQGYVVQLTPQAAQGLRNNPSVASIEKDIKITGGWADAAGGSDAGTVTQSSPPWNVDQLDSRSTSRDGLYTSPADGAGVRVYMLDSGIRRTHAEFANTTVSVGRNFAADKRSGDTSDCNGHGTHTSGTVVGAISGAAKKATLVPLRVLECDGSGDASAFVLAADYAVADKQAAPGPTVANVSLGAAGSTILNAATQGMISNGITVTVAAGNTNIDACDVTPASVPGAITVASIGSTGYESSFSNHGPCVDLYAGGENVPSAWWTSDTAFMTESGTSMSAPAVAGSAAIILSQHPTWSPTRVWDEMRQRGVANLVKKAASANLTAQVTPAVPGTFRGTNPARILDSRSRIGTSAKVAPNTVVTLGIWGRGGVPTGASAVTMNVTVTQPGRKGYITVWPSQTTQPTASNLNFVAGETTPNLVTVPIGKDGKVKLLNASAGYTHLIADVQGYYVGGAASAAGTLEPTQPTRLVDTRSGGGAPVASGTDLVLTVTGGAAAVPTTASDVVLNVTVTGATSRGYLTVYPDGAAVPNASNLNYATGQTIPNQVSAKVGTDGKIRLRPMGGSAHLIVDLEGYVTGGSVTAPGGFVPITPVRALDTRATGKVGPGATVSVGMPSGVPSTAYGVVVNSTVTQPTASGWVTVYPTGTARPTASNLNYVTGETVPNLSQVPLGGGRFSMYNSTGGSVHLIADIAGYYRN